MIMLSLITIASCLSAALGVNWLNNGKLKFGSTATESLFPGGALQKPWYYNSATSSWVPLANDGSPLELWLGMGNDGADMYNSNNPKIGLHYTSGINIVLDDSMYEPRAVGGVGRVSYTAEYSIGQTDVIVQTTVELKDGDSFITGTTTVTVSPNAVGEVTNVRLWVGVGDDNVDGADSTTKVRGSLSNSGFSPLPSAGDYGSALLVSGGDTSVFLFTMAFDTEAVIASSDSPSLAVLVDTDRNIMPTSVDSNAGFGLFFRLPNLNPGQSESVTWVYGAASTSEVESVMRLAAFPQAADMAARQLSPKFFGALFGTTGAIILAALLCMLTAGA